MSLICCVDLVFKTKQNKKVVNCNRNATTALYIYTKGRGQIWERRDHYWENIFSLNSGPNQQPRWSQIFATEIMILDRFLKFKFTYSHSCKSWLSASSDLGDLLHSLIAEFVEDESNARACPAVMSKIWKSKVAFTGLRRWGRVCEWRFRIRKFEFLQYSGLWTFHCFELSLFRYFSAGQPARGYVR